MNALLADLRLAETDRLYYDVDTLGELEAKRDKMLAPENFSGGIESGIAHRMGNVIRATRARASQISQDEAATLVAYLQVFEDSMSTRALDRELFDKLKVLAGVA
jgi:hypothetical protein